jgi:hypothetical protein
MPSEPQHYDPQEMARRGRIGAYRRLKQIRDRAEMTRPARDKKRANLERELDPHHELSEEELARRVAYAMKEWSARAHQQRWRKP